MAKEMSLPSASTAPKGDLTDQSILIYGMPKIGKSTLAASFPGALFIPFEPGLNHLDHFQIPTEGIIESWPEFLEACAIVSRNPDSRFKTIVIDTVDLCYQLCSDHVCKQRGVEYVGDIPHGKGWTLVANEFMRVLKKLAALPYGLVLISHAKTRTVTENGIERDVIQTTLTESARKLLTGMVDMILYVDVDEVIEEGGGTKYRRVIRTKPNRRFDAGDRTGRLPREIIMEQHAPFAGFQAAWEAGSKTAKRNDAPAAEESTKKETKKK